MNTDWLLRLFTESPYLGLPLTFLGLCGLWVLTKYLRRDKAPGGLHRSQEPTTKLSVVQATTRDKRCGNCSHWDLEEGQAALRANPAFFEAAKWVTPQRMSIRYDDNGNPSPATVPAKVAWKDFGGCLLHEEGRHRDDNCEQFAPRVADVTPMGVRQ